MLRAAQNTAHRSTLTMTGKFLMVLLVLAVVIVPGDADAARRKSSHKRASVTAPQPDRYAAIVMEAQTGLVLSEKNADKRLYPASLTKMMTLYLTFEAIDNGKLQKYSRIPVSKRAAFQEPSELGLEAGTTIRVEDAILGLVTKSANDAAVTLAEAVGGSEPRFAALMTSKARQLGMMNTRFVNASGLFDPAQISSARDMAILGQALMRDYPRDYRYFSTANFTFAGKTYSNHNHLMKTYRGMDGLKTGYVYASGYNLAASAVQDGRRLIGVVFGGKTAKIRNDTMAQLLDAGFAKANDPRVARLIDDRRRALAQVASAATKNGKLPARKPVTATTIAAQATDVAMNDADSYAASGNVAAPQFDAMGLAVEEGDAADIPQPVADSRRVTVNPESPFTKDFQPRSLNTQLKARTISVAADPQEEAEKKIIKTAAALSGNWSVQVGAFSSHEAGMSALQMTRGKLPDYIAGSSQYLIAPLMTNRGMIYRARLAGMAREQATQACRILQGNCLILASR